MLSTTWEEGKGNAEQSKGVEWTEKGPLLPWICKQDADGNRLRTADWYRQSGEEVWNEETSKTCPVDMVCYLHHLTCQSPLPLACAKEMGLDSQVYKPCSHTHQTTSGVLKGRGWTATFVPHDSILNTTADRTYLTGEKQFLGQTELVLSMKFWGYYAYT